MGRSKALLPWDEQTIIAHHAGLMNSQNGGEAWIVMQQDDPALSAELDRIQWPSARRVINPLAPDCDMLASIQCGVRAALDSDAVAIGIALVDQPLIQRNTINALLSAARKRRDEILQPLFEGRRGHPVLLPRSVAHELALFSGLSLREFLAEHHEQRGTLEVDDPGVVTDLDTPAEYQKYFDQQGVLQ